MVEPWYATAYCVDKLTDSTIQEWVQRAPSEHLRLPVANQFIATDLSLKKTDKVMYPVIELSHFLRCCRLSYIGLITGSAIDMMTSTITVGSQTNCCS
ncbi:insulin-degrading enzyme-like 1, peroxisomal [Eucalyptus grandis]|uniref:insulin-degrading enzyme-like 1, peroxisomal n=1 Tax=Eucalyptus grandis TaxID=71139 RepID=UPI0008A0F00E|nr:insulin-degrading enzyme-like 1, peroxisomal [Eucalyptus grandis]